MLRDNIEALGGDIKQDRLHAHYQRFYKPEETQTLENIDVNKHAVLTKRYRILMHLPAL